MDSSDNNKVVDVPNFELSVKDKTIEEKSTSISENGIVEEELSEKDKTIEEIIKHKSNLLLSRKERKVKNRKSSKVQIRKRYMKIIRSIRNKLILKKIIIYLNFFLSFCKLQHPKIQI